MNIFQKIRTLKVWWSAFSFKEHFNAWWFGWKDLSDQERIHLAKSALTGIEVSLCGVCGDVERVLLVECINYNTETREFEFRTNDEFYSTCWMSERSVLLNLSFPYVLPLQPVS